MAKGFEAEVRVRPRILQGGRGGVFGHLEGVTH
jgi:hypothetical protein